MKLKRLLTAFAALAVMLFAATCFAADEQESIADGADITGIRRMALAEPLYTVLKDGPGMADISQAIFDASTKTSVYVINYGDIAANIKRDTDVDIRPLNHRQAMKIFKICVPKYVDAYVIPTIANNNRKTVFFDVYQVKTDALLYRYQLMADKNAEESYLTYRALSEQFFKRLDRAIDRQRKQKKIEAEKQARLDKLFADPKKRAEYEAKSAAQKRKIEAKAQKKAAALEKERDKDAEAAYKAQLKEEAKAQAKRQKKEDKAAKLMKQDQERAEKAAKRDMEKAQKQAKKSK